VKRLAFILFAASFCALAQPWYNSFTRPYLPRSMPPVNFVNSARLNDLFRAGNLYLSLPDAIALALDNNLDIVFERYSVPIAATDVQRAKGGGILRGIDLLVNETPPGIGGPLTPLLNAAANGAPPSTSVPTGLEELSATVVTRSGIGITGAADFSLGPPIPQFDPAIIGFVQYQRQTIPELNVVSGGNVVTNTTYSGDIGVQKGFATGATGAITFNTSRLTTNSSVARLSPSISTGLGFTFTQPLLRGFGIDMNRRFIRIARNNEQTSSEVFRQQVIATVSGVIRLYYDLVSLTEDVKVKESTLAQAERLREDNSVAVQQGTLAPVELTRAEAQVAAARQDLANSRGFELQQELVLKTVLTKRGTAEPAIRTARVIPTTPIDVPAHEPVHLIDELMGEAMRFRPELHEARLQIENSHIALTGSRNELLPQLDIVANAQNVGLAGVSNNNVATNLSPGFTGGFGTTLDQIANGRFPTYSIGIQLNLPIHNRIARADFARDDMMLRQWEVRYQQLENQIRLEVEGALIALEQTRTAYDAAVEARILQEQSLTIEMEKLANGLSTTFLVLQYQSFVAQARSTEVAARGVYAKARTQLERAIGLTLEEHNIAVNEVYRNQVTRPVR
jgi:outer membrane protein TolC